VDAAVVAAAPATAAHPPPQPRPPPRQPPRSPPRSPAAAGPCRWPCFRLIFSSVSPSARARATVLEVLHFSCVPGQPQVQARSQGGLLERVTRLYALHSAKPSRARPLLLSNQVGFKS
jgi:hypothetical protein